ncbi:hypothetical protein [Lacticaseibacillus zhaodongensis]|uniref:hypothetical protein n=1 Tax=Lacticaseibacillus zhaodongensis TaxID=2668065 RepID=UPI0012D30781|nr:hypothetical protein [Lacticaseibacillus zhaodongensis]
MPTWQIGIIILVFVLAVGLGVLIALRRGRIEREYQAWTAIADARMNAALSLCQYNGSLQGSAVENVWGHHIALLSYALDAAQAPTLKLLEKNLNRNAQPEMVITDSYQRDPKVLHVDVALLVNDNTRKYLEDLARIKEHNS